MSNILSHSQRPEDCTASADRWHTHEGEVPAEDIAKKR